MAASLTVDARMKSASGRIHIITYSTNENYVTGGFAVTANQMGLNKINTVLMTPVVPLAGTTAYVGIWNGLTGKIQYFWVDTTVDGNPLVEVPNATAVGALFSTLVAFGDTK